MLYFFQIKKVKCENNGAIVIVFNISARGSMCSRWLFLISILIFMLVLVLSDLNLNSVPFP